MEKLFFLGSLFCIFLFAGAQESYVMYETMYIKPKADQLKEFNEALSAHNKQFHANGANAVAIQWVVNGPKAGQFVWVMGPCTFTDLDNRPSDDAHDDDWNLVMPFVREISEVEYWRMDPDLSYTPEGWSGSDKIHIRAWDIKPGKIEAVKGFLQKAGEVFRTKKYDNSWHVYWNVFDTGNGRDVAGVYGFDKWAEYDEESPFVMDFDEIHGEGAWSDAMAMMSKVSTINEELRELVPELGGATE